MEQKNTEISIGDPQKFKTTIDSFLKNLGVDVSDSMDEAITEIGKEAVEKLKMTSPVRKKGKSTGYAKAWKFKKNMKGKTGAIESKVYNEQGNLTHLLEKEHPIVSNGRVVGRAKAHPHIKPVEEWVQSELPKRIAKKIRESNQ